MRAARYQPAEPRRPPNSCVCSRSADATRRCDWSSRECASSRRTRRRTSDVSAALAWRGYKAVGGEFMLLLLPIIYYEAKRIILDFVADFVELYRRAED